MKTYGNKGEDVVDMNFAAMDAGATAYPEVAVPAEWAEAPGRDRQPALKGRPELVSREGYRRDPL